MRQHVVAWEVIQRDGVTVGREIRPPVVLGRGHRKRLFEIARRQQIARVLVGSRAVRRRPQMQIPIKHVAVLVEACFCFHHHGRAVGLPAMFALAGVLQADGLAGHGCGQQGRVGGCVIGHIMAVATRALNVLAADFRDFEPEHFGDGFRRLEHRLAMRLDRHHAVGAHGGDSRRRADGGMHVIGAIIGRLHRLDGRVAASARLFLCFDDARRLGLHQPVLHPVIAGQVFLDVPFGRIEKRLRRSVGLLLAFGYHAQKAARAHDLHDAGHFLDGA